MMSTRNIWRVAIGLAAACAVAVAWFPLLTINALPAVNYNEGWNAYRQLMALRGQPLYGAPNWLWTTNYPFLSFHIVALLGGTKAHMVLAGRVVCFASLLAVAVLAGLVVRRETCSRAGAVYAGLALFAWLGAFYGRGRAVDDPEMLGAACAMLGLYAYRRGWPVASALVFACGLFVKHDFVAFPLSVALYMAAARQWRGLGVFAAAGCAACAALLAVSYHIDGPYFLQMLLQKRAYLWGNLVAETLHYLLHFGVVLAIGAAALWRVRGRGFWLVLLLCTNALAVAFAGGDGVAANIFYPAIIADVLACVVGLCGVAWFAPPLMLTALVGAVMVCFQMGNDISALRQLPARAVEARAAISVLAAVKGPVMCEDMLLCYDAGKPMNYDPYYVRDEIWTGRVKQAEAEAEALFTARGFAAVQVDGGLREGRFTAGMLRAMEAGYRPVLAGRDYTVFVPRG